MKTDTILTIQPFALLIKKRKKRCEQKKAPNELRLYLLNQDNN